MRKKEKEEPTSTSISVSPKLSANIESLTKNLRGTLASLVVQNEQDCLTARSILGRIMVAKGKAQAFIQPILENAKEGLRLAKEQEATLVGPLRELESEARKIINRYLTDVEFEKRRQEEEQERLKREREEKLAKSKRPERIKELSLAPIVETPKMENTVVPMVPKYEIENEDLVPEKFKIMVIDREKLWAEIRSAHKIKSGPAAFSELEIPGVRIWEEAQIGIRRG